MKPHAIYDMPESEYHSGPWVHSHDLADLLKMTPAAFQYAKAHPEPPSDAMQLGGAFHALVLQPEEFAKKYIAQPPEIKDRRTKAWGEFATLNSDKTIIRPDDYTDLLGWRQSFLDNPDIAPIIRDSQHEVSLFWTDEETGIEMCARLDMMRLWKPEGVACIDDTKTAKSADPEEFMKACIEYGYDIQSFTYIEGVRHVFGIEKVQFAFDVVEKTAPYLSVHYTAPDSMIELGRVKYRAALKKYAECRDSKIWSGYASGELPPPPVWELKKWGV